MNNDIFWAAFGAEIDKIASVKSTVKGVGMTAAAMAALAGGGRDAAANTIQKIVGQVNPVKMYGEKDPSAKIHHVSRPGDAEWINRPKRQVDAGGSALSLGELARKLTAKRTSLEDKVRDVVHSMPAVRRFRSEKIPLEERVRNFMSGRPNKVPGLGGIKDIKHIRSAKGNLK